MSGLRLSLVVLVLTTACASDGSDARLRPEDQAATAVALSQRPPLATPGPPQPGDPVFAAATRPASSGSLITTVSVDGKIALSRDDGILLIEKGQARPLFTAPPGGSVKDPVWSPDGTILAFAYAPPRPRPTPGSPIIEQLLSSDIMIVEGDGSNPRPAISHDGPGVILETPAWAPDGRAIYFSFYAPQYRGDQLIGEKIEVRRAEIGAGTPTTIVPDASSPAVSPDGQRIAYVAEDPAVGPTLRVQAIAGGTSQALTVPEQFASILAPRFSPDGAVIAFSAASMPENAPDTPSRGLGPLDLLRELVSAGTAHAHGLPWEIWTVPSAGPPARQLTQIVEDTPIAAWSADGSRLLVYGAGGLHLVDTTSGSATLLTPDGAHGGMDWRSNG